VKISNLKVSISIPFFISNEGGGIMDYPRKSEMDGLSQTTNYYLAMITYNLEKIDKKLAKLLEVKRN